MITSYRRTALPPALHRSPARILYQRGVTVDFPLRNGVQIHFVFKHTTLEYGALIKFRRLETISSKDVHTIHISIVAIHAAVRCMLGIHFARKQAAAGSEITIALKTKFYLAFTNNILFLKLRISFYLRMSGKILGSPARSRILSQYFLISA